MTVRKIGDWAMAKTILGSSTAALGTAIDVALHQEAQEFRRDVVKGIRDGAPGGKPFKPLSPMTKAIRKVINKRSSPRPLIQYGDLWRSITVTKGSNGYFVGVLRSARGANGQKLVNLAAVHEFGSKPITIKMTDQMRRFLAMVFRKAGLPKRSGKASTTIVVRVPARPFLTPVADKRRDGAARRVSESIAKALGYKLGSP